MYIHEAIWLLHLKSARLWNNFVNLVSYSPTNMTYFFITLSNTYNIARTAKKGISIIGAYGLCCVMQN